jgi:hypothetical protein
MGLNLGQSPQTSPREGRSTPRAASSRRILPLTPEGKPIKPEDEHSIKNHLFFAVERGDLEMTWSVLTVHEVPTLQLLFAVSDHHDYMTLYDKALFEDNLRKHEGMRRFWVDHRRGMSDGLFTPLHIAARQGNADVASCLLHNLERFVGADAGDVVASYCNKVTCAEENITPLHLAVYSPLAEDSADASSSDCCPAREALQEYIEEHHIIGDRLGCLADLLSHGASINQQVGCLQGI